MKRLSDVDLILLDKKIYHLDISKDDIADTIITVGDPERVALVSKFFDKIEVQHQHREFIIHTGYFNNKRLSVFSTGMGTQNIDIVMNELDALVNIDFNKRTVNPKLRSLRIIRLGTTGAIQESIPLQSFIVNTHAIDMTGLMHYYDHSVNPDDAAYIKAFTEYMKDKLPPFPISIHAGDSDLIDGFSTIPNCLTGVAVTCHGFYAPQGRKLRLATHYDHIAQDLSNFSFDGKLLTNLEMETGAIYGLGKILGHQCCSVNIVAINRITKESIKPSDRIQEKLIEFSLEAFTKLP